MKPLRAADLFCGAGGTSAGAESSGACRVDFAVNHWDVAVQTHSANFPHTKHVNSRIDMVNPAECGKIDLLFASPECTHHSRARGGRPTSDQQRSGAWDLMRWIEHHRPGWIVVENVREFEQWGPVHNGRPMTTRRGAFFEAWVAAIRAAGYQVDWRILNAADFGAATSRERLFVVARKGRKHPVFPEPTHCQFPGGELPGMSLPRWHAAADIIDWKLPCPSIFSRKRPLADKTLLRIEAGLRKFCGPFVAAWDQTGGGDRIRSVGSPIGTLVTKANLGLAIPFQYQLIGMGAGRSRSAQDPVPTIVATRENHGVVIPYQVILRNNGDAADCGAPVGTVTANGKHHGLAVPLVMSGLGGGQPRPTDNPTPTLTASGCCGLITPFLADVNHGGPESRAHSSHDPLRTVTAKRGESLIVPYLVHYYGTENISPVTDPLDTITTKERHGLAMVKLLQTMRELQIVDIGFRMLANHELAAAQGFPTGYVFAGNKSEVTRQIGNSVSPPNARALTEAIAAA